MYKCTPSGLAVLLLASARRKEGSLRLGHLSPASQGDLTRPRQSCQAGRGFRAPGGGGAAAAYRAGERLYDSSQGKWFEFDKPDVVHTEILAPPHSPRWVFDRQTL